MIVLSPRQLAEAIGVSESSVKRWIDNGHIAADKTAGGHRRITLQEAARYIRDRRLAVVRPDLLGLSGQAAAEGAAEAESDAGERLFKYLKAGAAAEARSLLLSAYLGGASVAELVDGPLAHAMEKIGELWVASPSGIYWEHRATEIAIQAVARLRLLLAPRPGAPTAVGGAPTGDQYVLPSLSVAAVLEGEGLEVTNLGPETPAATLALAAEDLDAHLVWLSVSVVGDADKLRRDIDRLAARLSTREATLVVGGSAARGLGLAKSSALYVGRSMAELEALVRGMRSAPRPAVSSG